MVESRVFFWAKSYNLGGSSTYCINEIQTDGTLAKTTTTWGLGVENGVFEAIIAWGLEPEFSRI